jgi:hypothetical protein
MEQITFNVVSKPKYGKAFKWNGDNSLEFHTELAKAYSSRFMLTETESLIYREKILRVRDFKMESEVVVHKNDFFMVTDTNSCCLRPHEFERYWTVNAFHDVDFKEISTKAIPAIAFVRAPSEFS